MERNSKGQFAPGNKLARKGGAARAKALPAPRRTEIARQGWDTMVTKHFAGDQTAARRWWGLIGAWASDVTAGYAGTWMQVFRHPGTPQQFIQRFYAENLTLRQALEFTLEDVEPKDF